MKPDWKLVRVRAQKLTSVLYEGTMTLALLRCRTCGALADLALYGDVVDDVKASERPDYPVHYAVVVVGDVEPQVHGPFSTENERDEFVKAHRRGDPGRDDGLYWMDISEPYKPVIGAYAGGFFQDPEEA